MRPEGIPTTSESSDEEEELDAYEEQMERQALIRKQNPNDMRISVSAEVYGEYNKKKNFNPPINEKKEEVMQNIILKLKNIVLFKHLENKEMRVVALAMKKIEFESN